MESRLRGRDLERCLDLERFLDLDRREVPGLDRDRARRPAGDRPLVGGERFLSGERPRDQERRDRPF